MRITIYFDGQFWVALIEREWEGRLQACRHVFGAEPGDGELAQFLESELPALLRRMQAGVCLPDAQRPRRVNAKRLQREVAAQLRAAPVSRLTHEALQAQLQLRKQGAQAERKLRREAEQERRWQLAREKARKKARGH